ncbi:MAG: hypothetical protein U1F53_01305 [Burkholderiaceae bacterium]
MVPFIYRVDNIALVQAETGPDDFRNLYDVTLSNNALGTKVTIRATHVPPEVAAFAGATQGEVHVVVLDVNSLASHVLAGRPQSLITGFVRANGQRIPGLPRELRDVRRWGIAATSVVTGAGLGAAALGWGFWGALLATVGALGYRTFAAVPGKSFWGHEDDLGFKGKVDSHQLHPAARHASANPASPDLLDLGSQDSRIERQEVQ